MLIAASLRWARCSYALAKQLMGVMFLCKLMCGQRDGHKLLPESFQLQRAQPRHKILLLHVKEESTPSTTV